MNPINTRPNTPDVPRTQPNREAFECDTCGRLARSYIAMTVKDRQTKYFCTHKCFREKGEFEMCYMCYQMSATGRKVAAGAGQVFLCSKECENSYSVEIFN